MRSDVDEVEVQVSGRDTEHPEVQVGQTWEVEGVAGTIKSVRTLHPNPLVVSGFERNPDTPAVTLVVALR